MTSRVERTFAMSADQIWDVLSDGWLFTNWVVGASRIRAVDRAWPELGSAVHHSVGVWPVVIDDATTVIASTPGRLLELRARAWPAGEARVTVTLTPSGDQTLVEMCERVTGGPFRAAPSAMIDPVVSWRNRECLTRLEFLVRGRTG